MRHELADDAFDLAEGSAQGAGGVPVPRAARLDLRRAQPGEKTRNRARVEARPDQPTQRLAVRPNRHGPQRPRPVGPVQAPVLLRLPEQEAERIRQQPDVRKHDQVGGGFAQERLERLREPGDQSRLEGQDELVGHGGDRELERVDARLDQHDHVEPGQVRDRIPQDAEHGADGERDVAVAAAEAQPFVHGEEHVFERVGDLLEDADDEADQARQETGAEVGIKLNCRVHDEFFEHRHRAQAKDAKHRKESNNCLEVEKTARARRHTRAGRRGQA